MRSYDYTDTGKLSFYVQGETFAFFDYLRTQYGAVKKDRFKRAECLLHLIRRQNRLRVKIYEPTCADHEPVLFVHEAHQRPRAFV